MNSNHLSLERTTGAGRTRPRARDASLRRIEISGGPRGISLALQRTLCAFELLFSVGEIYRLNRMAGV